MKIHKTQKKVLSFKKSAIKDFLNGLTSNDMDAANNAFLNIHGRIVATFDQIQVSEDEYFLLVEENYVSEVLKHVDRYIKLGGVQVELLDMSVYFDLDNTCEMMPGDHIIEQKSGKLIITYREIGETVSDHDYCLFRLENHIPVQGIDYTDEMLLNVSTTDYVSFSKGCFLGQEPISKVYNRSKPTWRLVVKSEDDCDDKEKERMTSKMLDPQTHKAFGFVFEKNE